MENVDANIQRRQLFNLNFFIMSKEQEMLELFQVEELEKRYEMGWLSGWKFSATASVNSNGVKTVGVTLSQK